MATIKATNFASTTLQTGISDLDLTVNLSAGTGALFPTLGAGEYFYGVFEDTNGNREIVKVTARTVDALTIERAKEGTTAQVWAGGTVFELRPTVQTVVDLAQQAATNAAGISFTPAGDLAATDVQAALEELDSNVQAYDADTAKLDIAQTFTAPQRGALTTDNDGSFDQSVTNKFKCTPTGAVALTFTNHTAGHGGTIIFINSSNYEVTAAATTYISASDLTKLSATGNYLIGYEDDGTNTYCVVSAALTSAGA